ncbi:MAG: UDP-N-acetylmuramate dehydrogenase [Bacteroidota bacterium]|nr:UDP-N-acetylmuramate dehydrogenase [Bacteroidota bacterium]
MIRYNYSLRKYNTFGVTARTRRFINLTSAEEAKALIIKENFDTNNCLVLSGGSNILFTKDYCGTVIKPSFDNITIEEKSSDNVIISAEAGLEWDRLVEWSVENDLGGLENLSFIPGKVGAAPIQNIGAYGAEVSSLITRVHTLSLENSESRIFYNEECMFGYRDSIFKNELKGKYLITRVEFRLKKSPVTFNLSYGNLEPVLQDKGEITLTSIRKAVIKIRKEKLPDPAVKGNAGSFFKNPVIDMHRYADLKMRYHDMPSWQTGTGQYKIPAAWLIEKAGWKGKKAGRAGVHHKHALILVNLGNAEGSEILELSNLIIDSVRSMFGITLVKEVNII